MHTCATRPPAARLQLGIALCAALVAVNGCSPDDGAGADDASAHAKADTFTVDGSATPIDPGLDPYAGETLGAVARYELVAAPGEPLGWHASPFPTDLRRDAATGRLDLSGFPAPKTGEVDALLAAYLALGGQALAGWSIQPTIYVQLDKAIRGALLPTPQESISKDDAGMMLVNVDVSSPGYGERVPLRWKLSAKVRGNILAANLLMAQPTWGAPLRAKTTYAFVLDRKMRDIDDRMLARPKPLAAVIDHLTGAETVALSAEETKLAAVLTPLWVAIKAGKVPMHPKAIAAATVFTTGDPTAELASIAAFVRSSVAHKAATGWKQSGTKNPDYRIYRGTYSGPNFQAGQPPFLESGGGFEFGANGTPKVQKTETLRISISVPDDRSQAVGGLLPVVIYSHGTGGSYESYRSGALAPGRLLTEKGIVVIGIDQPLHGPRAGKDLSLNAVYLATFNFFNPLSGRSVFRQAALDNVHLIELLRAGKLDIPGDVTHDKKPIRLDANRMLFMGHSQGGIVGPLLASVEPNFRAFVFSGAGAGLSLTAVTRKDIVNFPLLISAKLSLDDDELSEFHPAVSLIQMLVDATDTLSYARHVFARPADIRPPHVLMTEGLLDEATPAVTSEALAAAMGLSILKPAAHLNEAMEIANTPILQTPVQNNLKFGEHQVTAILAQYPKGNHYVVFQNESAALMARDFLFSVATTGEAIIE